MDFCILNIIKHIFVAIFLGDVIFVSVDCFVPAALIILALLPHIEASHLKHLSYLIFVCFVITVWIAPDDRMHQILGCQLLI